jgi:hypothetical protein
LSIQWRIVEAGTRCVERLASAPRPPPELAGVVHDLEGCLSHSQPRELTFVDMDTFETTF